MSGHPPEAPRPTGTPEVRLTLHTLALLAAWLLPGLVAAGWLLRGKPDSLAGLLLHALLLLALLQTVLVPSLPDLLAGHWPASLRRATAVALGTLQLALLVFYGGSVAGQHYWGNWLTLELALAYAPQLPGLLRVLEIWPGWVMLGVAAAWMALVVFYLRALAGVGAGRAAVARAVPSRQGLLLMLGLVAALMGLYRAWWLDWRFWRAEPLRQASLSTGFWGEAGLRSSVSPERLQRDRLAATSYPDQLNRTPGLRPRPLVLIVVDALRPDVMGVYGAPVDNTPFLSSLHRAGSLRRIDDVYAVCTASYCGILGTLASRHWFQLTPQPWNVADALRLAGYESRFILSGDHTSFFGLRRMFGTGVALVHDGSNQTRRYVNDDRLVLDALDQKGWPTERPGFLYVHLMSAHRLGELQPQHQRWTARDTPVVGRFEPLDPQLQRETHARYHNGIRQTDAMIQQIFQRLQRLGVLDDALVVITSDHGEHLGEMGLWSHGQAPHEPGVRIPLLVMDRSGQLPPFAPRRLVGQTDIAPTLLRAIGAPVPDSWAGTPLQQPLERTALVVESAEWTGLVFDAGQGRYKYLRHRMKGTEQLFRVLATGGAETDDLAGRPEHAALLLQLRTEHDRLRAR